MILEEETYKKFGYYPSDLKPYSNKRILAACDGCGKIREMNKRNFFPLCKSCAHKGERNPMFGKSHSEESRLKISQNRVYRKGKNHPSYKLKIKCICLECGKEFLLKASKVKKGGGKYCSIKCFGNTLSKNNRGEKNPAWKGGPIRCKCKECKKIFYAPLNEIKKGWGIYCSRQCQTRGIQRNKNTPTKPERIFEDICKRNNLPFRFVGDGALWIGKKGHKQLNPDFIEENGKKVLVEIMGGYWHSPLLNQNLREDAMLEYRKRHYRRYKWHPIFIWDTDLLREDTEVFVLSTIQKLKI